MANIDAKSGPSFGSVLRVWDAAAERGVMARQVPCMDRGLIGVIEASA
jgi:hypothetical protein